MKTARDRAAAAFAGFNPKAALYEVYSELEASVAKAIEDTDAEYRRLVEEAQTETKRGEAREHALGEAMHRAQDDAARCATDVDRLKGERDACASAAQTMTAIEADRRIQIESLKGELAEARRLLNCQWLRCAWCQAERNHYDWCPVAKLLAATPPAEQAQPARDPDWGNEDAIVASTCSQAAKQAQGEGAPKWHSLSLYWDGKTAYAMMDGKRIEAPPMVVAEADPVAALAKRVNALEHEAQEDAKAWADTAFTLMNRVTKLEAPAPPPPEAAGPAGTFDDTLAKATAALEMIGTGWPERQRQREAAGPGHVFACTAIGDDIANCSKGCICRVCDKRKKDHAVPPIPDGCGR